jgi:hypothetical protein
MRLSTLFHFHSKLNYKRSFIFVKLDMFNTLREWNKAEETCPDSAMVRMLYILILLWPGFNLLKYEWLRLNSLKSDISFEVQKTWIMAFKFIESFYLISTSSFSLFWLPDNQNYFFQFIAFICDQIFFSNISSREKNLHRGLKFVSRTSSLEGWNFFGLKVSFGQRR